MGIIKGKDIIAYQEGNQTFCCDCSNGMDDVVPLTQDDFDEDDFVYCDRCNSRIQ